MPILDFPLRKPLSLRHWLQYVMPAALVIAGLTVCTDYLEAQQEQAAFYFSESALFSIFWCLFPPLLFLQHRVLRAMQHRSFFRMGLSIALPLLLHGLGYAGLVNLFGTLFLGHGFQWTGTLTYALTEFYHVLIIAYTLPAVIGARTLAFRPLPVQNPVAGAVDSILPAVSIPLEASQEEPSGHLQVLTVREGMNTVFVPVRELICVQSSSPYLKLQLAKRHYLHAETLRSMALKLDPGTFVRVHKSTIVRKDAVCKMTSRANGDYDLLLSNGQQVRMSRRYVSAFRATEANGIAQRH